MRTEGTAVAQECAPHTGARRRFKIVLIKPSHYDADGYVIQWWRSTIPSNSLASVYGLLKECAEDFVLGPETDIEIEASDGSVGFAVTTGGEIGAFIVERHLARFLEGQRVTDIEKMWDQMYYATLYYGRKGVVLNTISGVKLVDGKLIEMARIFGASRAQVFKRVVLPAATPAIFVGLRLSATTSLLLLVAAEMIGAKKGLGFLIINAQYNFEIPLMFAAIVLLAIIGLAVNYALLLLQMRFCRWQYLHRSSSASREVQ